MSYSDKLQLVKQALIKDCKDRICDNWNKMFDMWLSVEAHMEFGDLYQFHFKKEFSQYITSEIERILYFAGNNIFFVVCTFIQNNTDADLEDVLDFTESFISNQLDDFDNWCDEISMAMPDEDEKTEDNPS